MNHPAVKTHVSNPRSSCIGDVIVDPTYGAWEIQNDGYQMVDPPGPVQQRMEREGIVPGHVRALEAWLKESRETNKPRRAQILEFPSRQEPTHGREV